MHFTLTDLLTDIAQNGAESGASIVELHIHEADSSGKEEFCFTVKDNGKGMTDTELKSALDPFVSDGTKQTLLKHPHRKVGLGLPFLIQTTEVSGGRWEIKSIPVVKNDVSVGTGVSGTTVSAWFDLSNVDTPPIGDIPGMFRTVLLFAGPQEVEIQRIRETNGELLDYQVRKTELAGALGDLEDSQSLILLDKYLRSLEN